MESIVLKEALKVLKKIPLCNRCLGRLFARLGKGMDNSIRGLSIKTMITMEVHRLIKEGYIKPSDITCIASHMSYAPLITFLEEHGVSVEGKRCFICNDRLDTILGEITKTSISELKAYEGDTFLVGVTQPPEITNREELILREFKIDTYESLKSEVKREVGKRIAKATGLKPEFEKPDILVHVFLDGNLESFRVVIKPLPLYIAGRYWKIGRNISQAKWLWRGEDIRSHRLSVEESLDPIREQVKGDFLKLHAAGREDIDARMLGTGRPAIVEISNPRRRRIDAKLIMEEVKKASNGMVLFKPEGVTYSRLVREIKESAREHKKIYRALIVTTAPVVKSLLSKCEEKFKGVVIKQYTPLRVLRRRAEKLRVKNVYDVKFKLIDSNVIEMIIKCDGGLYVKELVNGDSGRTKPSISEVLGVKAECVELDVLAILT